MIWRCQLPSSASTGEYEAVELRDGDRVRMLRSSHPVDIVASPFRNRYEILHEKLRWGERSGR